MTVFFAALDRLIQPELRRRATTDELRQLRLIGGVTACLLLQLFLFAMGMLQSMAMETMVCLFIVGISICTVLVRLRFWGRTGGAGPLLWLSILLISGYSAVHEGAQWALMSPILGVVVLLAMFLSGARSAVAAVVLSVLIVCGVVAVYELGWQLPPFEGGTNVMVATAVNACLGLVGLTFLAWLNHSSRRRAYQELQQALERVKASEAARDRAEAELRLAQKLESVGRLAAGVAHEINTPVQFVHDSMEFIEAAFGDLATMVGTYRELEAAAARGAVDAALLEQVARVRAETDLDYAVSEGPLALRRSKDGLARITKIVRSMRDFAHPDATEPEEIDLNRAIDSTLTIAAGEYKHVADVETSLAALPKVRCLPGELNQVILNLVVNAAHAVADRYRGTQRRGHITVKTWAEPGGVVIAVGDDGGGIPPEIQARIFDPFFTTKELGRGTGQGLSIARAVVVKRHGGSLTFETRAGEGTTFFVRLPVADGPTAVAA